MKRIVLLGGALIGALLSSGCVHLPASGAKWSRSLTPTVSATTDSARPEVDAFTIREKRLEARSGIVVKEIELAVDATSNKPGIVIEYYQLARGTNPVILLLPVSGGGYEVERYFARYFARRGLAVTLVHRTKVTDVQMHLGAIDVWLKQRVVDQQRVMDWVRTRPELDADRIGIFGISMGGIQGTLLTAVDERVQAAVLGLAGGDIPHILTHSTEKGIVRRREKLLREWQMTAEQIEERLRGSIEWEPNALAPCIDPQRVLMVLGVCDTVVPFKKGWELRENMGRPATLLLPTGHYTALFCVPFIERQSLKFFRERFGLQRQGGLPAPNNASRSEQQSATPITRPDVK